MKLNSGEINTVVNWFETPRMIEGNTLIIEKDTITSTTAGGSLIRCILKTTNKKSEPIKCSLKLLPHNLFLRKEGQELSTNRFLTALGRWANINHPAVAKLYSFGFINKITGKISTVSRTQRLMVSPDHLIYLLMEWVPGINLKQWIKKQKGVIRFPDILSILGSVSQGLSASHKADLVHLDIKPQNIIVKETNKGIQGASIIDWDLAHPNAVTQTGKTGTAFYYAPEMLEPKRTSFRADLFSLSVVALELLIGSHPFKKEMKQELHYVGFLYKYTPKMLEEMIGQFVLNWDLSKTISDTERNFIQTDYPRLIRSRLLDFLAKTPEERPLCPGEPKNSANWMIENLGGIPHKLVVQSLLSYDLKSRLDLTQNRLTSKETKLLETKTIRNST